jgi:hypothetical protein
MLCRVESLFLKMFHVVVTNDGSQRASLSHNIFLLEELVHLKIYGSHANLQQLRNGFELLDRPFRQCVIVLELISDDLSGFVNW